MIAPGMRIQVRPSPELARDPWIGPKTGWEGEVVAPADDVAENLWRVRFVPPWCGLGILRVMPGEALVTVEAVNPDVAPKPGQDGGMVGAQVRVKDGAGLDVGEEHIVRRRGQTGTVVRECVYAPSCVVVMFPGADRWVMIPRSYLQDTRQARTKKQRNTGQLPLLMGSM